MEVVQIEAKSRELFGKKHTKALRKEGLIPAIVYGGGDVTTISLTARAVKPIVYTPNFKVAVINVGGQKLKCILKEIIFHPVTDEIVHIDFLKLIDGTPVKVEIPVSFKGKSPGVKEGGKLIPQLRKVKVKTLPEKMVDVLYVDISELDLGGSVRVKDLEVPEGMEVMVTPAMPVAIVEVPRALKSEAAEAADEDETLDAAAPTEEAAAE
ncbi:MAG: 50S ribosomal protein L25 [Saprospiraceae bacterium]